jgi:competence protein ComEC
MSGSVVRAAVMFSILMIGNYTRRRIHPVNLLSATLLLILLVNPLLIMDVGLQLSIAAITGIRALYPLFDRLIERSNKIIDFVCKTVSISLAAQLGTLPIALHYFNQFPVYFLIANILVIPLAAVILYVEVFFEIFHAVPLLSAWAAKLLQSLLWFMNEYIFRIQQMPLALVRIGAFDWLDSVLFALLLISVFSFIFFRRKAWLYMAVACLLAGGSKYAMTFIERNNQRQLLIFHLQHSTGFEITKGYADYYFYSVPVDTIDVPMRQHYRQLSQTCILDSFVLGAALNKPVSISYPGNAGGMAYVLDTFHLVVVNSATGWNNGGEKQRVSTVLISNNPRVNAKQLFSWFDASTLILDGSDSKRTIHYWRDEAAKRNISFYCTGDSGAFIKKFSAK